MANLEYPVFESNVINVEKKVARHKLIQSYMFSRKFKSENPVEEPSIFGIVDANGSDSIQVWINKWII